MVNVKNNKIIRVSIGIVVLVVICVGILLKLLLFNSSYSIPETKVSAQLVDNIQKARNDGSMLQINKEELNEIISMYLKKEKTFGSFNVKGVYGDIVNNNLKLYIPSSYKGINFLITSEGSLGYKENKLEYTPSYFKVGKVNLPKNLVLKKLSNRLKKDIYIEGSNIVVNSDSIPLKIKSLEIKNNTIYAGIEKLSINIQDKLKSIVNNSGTPNSANNSTQVNEALKSANSQSSSVQSQASSDNQETKITSKNISEMDAALDRINAGLNTAAGFVSTGGEKAVISQMITSVNSMKGNPNADPYSYAGNVRSEYNSLSPQEKAELKSAVFSNINGNDVNILSKMLSK